MKKSCHISLLLLLAGLGCLLTACSTQKNTWASRSFHQTKVKYNILYNGNMAFEEGQKAIRDANEDDYSQVLNLYPVSNHKAAEAAQSQMDKTIEKCRKCIKLHSIKAKPKPNPKKQSDPKYKEWLKSEEFNNQMDKAWMRLGEAEFHKADFLGATGTFSYVMRHYSTDPDIVARCQLWIARSYGELGWLYEAEDMLQKVQVDNLSRKHSRLFGAVSADILLKTGQQKAAIPFVKIAIPYEKRKIYRPRFEYVLGQLYESTNQKSEAIAAYRRVIKLTPPTKMDFNARIRIAELSGMSALKQLRQMTKQSKYKDCLDQLYGTIGNIYLSNKDTAKALEMYELAIDTATQAGLQKAQVLIQAGDLYYQQCNYVKAQPCYREAVTILTPEHPEMARIQKISEVLDELIIEHETVTLQDSLQRLGHMTQEEQIAIVDKIIEALIQSEEEEKERERQAARHADEEDGLRSVNTSNMLGGGGAQGDWYFYNAQLLKNGKQEFRKKWGNRPLEDNWRRKSKTFTTSNEFVEDTLSGDSLLNDSLPNKVQKTQETDTHKREYYLQQIPSTSEEYTASDSLIRQALVQMVYIYHDKMQDEVLAQQTFAQLQERFPGHSDLLDLYYLYYLQALKAQDSTQAQIYRQQILEHYPESTQAQIVAQPDYFNQLQRAQAVQDSLYSVTFDAYQQNQFEQVKQYKSEFEQSYPLSTLMPRVLFLNAVAVARSEGQTAFIGQLQDMIQRYPSNELSAKAKDMLALMGQGMESQTGAMDNSLQALRAQQTASNDTTDSITATLSSHRKEPSVALLLLPKADEKTLNNLLYDVALFNFSQFMIRDFELQKLPIYGTGCALRVSGFESLDEAEWWNGLIAANTELQQSMQSKQVEVVLITETNLPLLFTKVTLEEYRQFMQTHDSATGGNNVY